MAAPTTMIDPTKQAEYPIVLGDRLAESTGAQSRLVNINYNYKTKSATPQQRSNITRSSRSRDLYDLVVKDKAPNGDNTLSYSYKGSEDPSADRNLVLVFDSDRKVFVLEPVSTKLNFNLRSAPGKTENQVLEQYEQLRVFQEEDHASGDDRLTGSTSEDEGPADDSNPYDYRHFLPKDRAQDDKPASYLTTPELSASRADTPQVPAATKSAPKPMARPKTQTNPLRQQKKRAEKPAAKSATEKSRRAELEPEDSRSPPSDAEASQHADQSPNSNIIIDGDLIIDMGSPPPSRPAFKVNPAYFSSNNTPKADSHDGDESMEDLRLPSPARDAVNPSNSGEGDGTVDDDALAAEMEAAFAESAREEEARSQQYGQSASRQYVASDDESEVSEEE
ncbi:hypothetical protein N7474_009790 [Penicillium riverlandense]|uniref:uncharacterized protein n=1 Tax=Penicillium riverlandense TaxID=1903569 RepID=UPI002548DF47|nr:uncharacterized protein N7474_009790 [Penicillium riverlandense]KAJ5808521.1 hypothetical protein N7474_009790 [Penicillium riverlandense]